MNPILKWTDGIELGIMSFLPGLIYLIIIFMSTPYKSWDFRRAMVYMLAGTFSLPIILGFHRIFPQWTELFQIASSYTSGLLILAFIQVAFLEESVKYILYWVFRKWVLEIKLKQHPLAIMIYAGAVSLGFAFTENLLYGFQNASVTVVYWRAITSVVIHMCCGMMMGYWISLSHYNHKWTTNPTKDIGGTSIFDVIMKNKPRFRRVFYTIMGLATAIFFHGLYDFNLIGIYDFSNMAADHNIAWSIQLIILTFSLYLVRNMSNHLIKLNIKNKAYENN